MKRKIIGIVAALVLAVVGTFALISYVQSAKDRAVAGEVQQNVYVVDSTIRKGAPATEIMAKIRFMALPAKAVAGDAITDLDEVRDDVVAAVDLHPGEQLLSSRLVDARDLTRVEVPTGLQELTISLAPERAVGGELSAGDTVGMLLSFDPFDLETSSVPEADAASGTEEASTPKKSPNMTHLTLHQILVTGVQFDQSDPADIGSRGNDESNDDGEADIERAPGNELLVTLAVNSAQAEQIVFAAEFGHVWLTGQNGETDQTGTRIVTLGEVYGLEVPR
ncbi:MAG: Flp pilus assembly protein CpaB [Acidimicrobiia bacterium]